MSKTLHVALLTSLHLHGNDLHKHTCTCTCMHMHMHMALRTWKEYWSMKSVKTGTARVTVREVEVTWVNMSPSIGNCGAVRVGRVGRGREGE